MDKTACAEHEVATETKAIVKKMSKRSEEHENGSVA